jgi:hypothetical protein
MKAQLTLLFVFLVFTLLRAQQPLNNDFESWASGDPTDWFTSDISGIIDGVSQAGSAYHGSSCVKLQVEDLGGGSSYPPYLTTLNPTTQLGHPVSEKHGSLHGYYKCNPQGNDKLLIGIAMSLGQSNYVGAGAGVFGTASSWTEFNIPIYYTPGSPNPDNVLIYFTVGDTSGNNPTIGSEAYVDYIDLTAPSSVEQLNSVPMDFTLSQNYPNPFNPSTKIEYSIPEQSFVQLKVYDILGNEVATLVNEEQTAGTYRADFSGNDFASGLYIAKLQAGNFAKTIKMSLLK